MTSNLHASAIAPPSKRRKGRWIALILIVLLLGAGLVAWFAGFEYAYLPDESKSSARAVEMKISGTGHEHWVDPQTGFSQADQQALIQDLFSLSLGPR